MKRLIAGGVLLGILGLGPAMGASQPARSGAGPMVDEERMARMMKMMDEMREQMKGMREQMQGMGAMHGRMGNMMGQMGQMRTMMDQHRGQMMQHCPAAGAPPAPTK